MTVNPGWGGQEFIEHSVQKLERLRQLLPSGLPLEVDGGIDADTAPRCRRAGATLFVAGSAVFGTPDPGKAYLEIADAIGG
jgi:ribulose-phosphate 3-epimerase